MNDKNLTLFIVIGAIAAAFYFLTTGKKASSPLPPSQQNANTKTSAPPVYFQQAQKTFDNTGQLITQGAQAFQGLASGIKSFGSIFSSSTPTTTTPNSDGTSFQWDLGNSLSIGQQGVDIPG